MERVLALLLAIFPVSALAVTPTAPPGFVLGGSGADAQPALSLSEYSAGYSSPYFKISAGGTFTADQCAPFMRDNTPYQVPVGKVALCYGPEYSAYAANSWFQTASSTTVTSAIGACTSLANITYQGGGSARYVYPVATAYVNYFRRDLIVFSSGRVPTLQYNGAGIASAEFTCREVQ